MTTLERIRHMPVEKRERILWTIVATTLVILILAWVITSKLNKSANKPGNFFRAVQEKSQKAQADFKQ